MMTTPGLGRLQVKLLMLVLVASLPAFFLLFWLVLQERESAIQSAKADLMKVAHLASLNQERYLEGARQVLKTISRTPLLQDGDPRRCTEYLQDLLGRASVFFNFGVFDIDGSLRCNALYEGAKANVADRPFFRGARDNMEFSVSAYSPGLVSMRKTLQFGHPLFGRSDGERLNGVVFASIDLEAYEQSLAGLIPGAAARLVFTDRDGTILGSYPAAPEKIGTILPKTHLLESIRAGKSTLVEDKSAQSAQNAQGGGAPAHLHAIDVVRAGNVIAMYTILSMPLHAVSSPIDRKFFWLSTSLAAALVAVMLIAWWLGERWIVRRASLISDAALRIGRGEHGVRTHLSTRADELDLAGHAFDRMAEALERRDADLRATNRRLAEAQRIARLGHWEFDVPSNRGWWSPESSEMFSIRAADDSFDSFLESIHPDDRQRVKAAYHCDVAGTLIDIEYRIIGIDGKLRWVHAVGECSRDTDGRVLKIAGIIQDTTERKKVEGTLKLLEAAVSRANDIVLITEAEPIDEPGPRIVFVNEAFETRIGYSREEVIGRSPRFLQGLNTSRTALDRIRAAMRDWKPVREELINYTKAGMPFWAELDITPIADETGRITHWVAIERDVTERKHAVAALIASEERYRLLFNSNPLPIVTYDAKTLRVTAANEAFRSQYGFSAEELKDRLVTDLHIPKTYEALWEEIQVLPMGISTVKGVRNIKRDGTTIDVEVTRIRADIDGKAVVISSPLDVTKRVRAEHALQASEERYRQLFESNPLPLWVYDAHTLRFLDVNDVACERYGYSRQEFLAMTIRDIRPAEDVPLLEQDFPEGEATNLGSGPWRHRRKDGSMIMVEINSHEFLMDGRRARFVCPIDVTDKVFAQEEIRRMNMLLERKVEIRTVELSRSLALQQSLFDNVPQIVWLADLNGSITFANRIWAENIGVAADDWKGDGWSQALHPEDRERVTREWREAAPKMDKFEIGYRFLHRDGAYHDYQVNVRKVFDNLGEPICWVGINSDVTDSRRREEAMRFANQELEAFSYSVSHDLRAPLRTISGFSERLQIESSPRLDEQGRHYLDRIRAGAANMSELIDDLLSLSQVTRNDMALGRIDLSKMAQQVFDELCQQEPDQPTEIVIQENMVALGDSRLLRVVLVNLIGNALKFSAKRPLRRVEVGENVLPGNTSMFFVRDNGAGFDPAYAARMFGVFQRLHSASEFAGTGIGLATVQRIIHRHGGRVSAEGAVDQGATIYFSMRRI